MREHAVSIEENSNRFMQSHSFGVRLLVMFLGQWTAMLGLSLVVHANLGLGPWELLAMAVHYHTPLTFGLAANLSGAISLIIGLLLKGTVGLETVLDIFVTGVMIDIWSLGLDALPHDWVEAPLWSKLLIMVVGWALYAFGTTYVMQAGFGCGPRDTLMVGLGKVLHRLPIGAVNAIILVVVFTFGALLGGPIGIGTPLSLILMSGMLQLACRVRRFEPRAVRHENLIQTLKRRR